MIRLHGFQSTDNLNGSLSLIHPGINCYSRFDCVSFGCLSTFRKALADQWRVKLRHRSSGNVAGKFLSLERNLWQNDYDDPNEIVRMARLSVKEANMRAARMQGQTTQQLVQRVKDLKYWSGEIDRLASNGSKVLFLKGITRYERGE